MSKRAVCIRFSEVEVEPPPTVVEFDDGTYAFQTGLAGYVYRIPCGQVKAPNMLGWLEHLAGKTWFGTDHVQQFLRLAEKHGGIAVNRCLI